jgi:hypothetical protein
LIQDVQAVVDEVAAPLRAVLQGPRVLLGQLEVVLSSVPEPLFERL